MTERALIRRELVRQTALLFFVFALLFALPGAGVYSMVRLEYLPKRRRNLQAIGMESDYITLDAAGSGSAIVDDVVVEEPDAPPPPTPRRRRPLPHASAEHRGRRSAVHHAHTKRAGRPSRDRGLYASYPPSCAYPFDKNDLERVYQIAAGVTSTAASRMRQTTKARPRIFRRW